MVLKIMGLVLLVPVGVVENSSQRAKIWLQV